MLRIVLFFILVIASLGDLLVPVIIGTKYPGYNHSIQTISTLGTNSSPVKIYQCTNLIIVGVLFLIFSIGQYLLFNQKTWAHNWYTVGIIIFGIGCILAGIFPEDIQGIPETTSGKIHGIASGIGFILLIMSPLWAVWINEFRDYKIMNIVLFVLGLLTFVLFLLSENKTSGFLKFTGLFQRVNLIILYGALIINYQKLISQANCRILHLTASTQLRPFGLRPNWLPLVANFGYSRDVRCNFIFFDYN